MVEHNKADSDKDTCPTAYILLKEVGKNSFDLVITYCVNLVVVVEVIVFK